MSDSNGNDNAKPMTQEEIEALLEGRGASAPGDGGIADDGDSIMSPEDIDKLFDSGAKTQGATPEDMAPSADDGDSILSPDEIDKLIAASQKGGGGSEDKAAADDGDSIMSPEDIDKLFDSGAKTQGATPEDMAPSADDGDSILSPDEIDKLIAAAQKDHASDRSADGKDVNMVSVDDLDDLFNSVPSDKIISPTLGARDTSLDEDLVLVDPEDIARIMNDKTSLQATAEETVDHGPKQDVSDTLSQDDIEALMGENITVFPQSDANASDMVKPPDDHDDETDLNIDQLLEDVHISSSDSQPPEDKGTIDTTPEPMDEASASITQEASGQSKEEMGEADTLPANDTSDMEDGLISQVDIDALLADDQQDTVPSSSVTDGEDASAEVSQQDIDELMQNAMEEVDAATILGAPADVGDDEMKIISQDDIDELLSDAFDSDDDIGLISQDDIDELLAGDSGAPVADESTVVPSSEDRDESVLEEEPTTVESPVQSALPEEQEQEQDSLYITQETIDSLLKEAAEREAKTAAAVPESDDSSQADFSQEIFDEFDGKKAGADASDSENEDGDVIEGLVSQEEIDALLSVDDGSQDTDDVDAETDDSGLISQDDIDGLLSKADEDDKGDGDAPSLISQEDIDQLLSIEDSSEDSAEDGGGIEESSEEISQDVIDKLLEEETDDSEDDAGLVTQDIIDQLLNEEVDEDEQVELDEKDQVILEELKEDEAEIEVRHSDRWYRSKLLWGVTASVMTLIISIVTIFLQEPPVTGGGGPQILSFTIVPEMPAEETPPQVEEVIMVSREFNGFVVMAPTDRKDIVYVEADITVDLSEYSAGQVNQFEPYFRDIIYDTIFNAMKTQGRLTMRKSDLQESIKSALNKALADNSIEKVIFTKFALI